MASFGFMLLPIASNKLQDSDYIKPFLFVFLQDISRWEVCSYWDWRLFL